MLFVDNNNRTVGKMEHNNEERIGLFASSNIHTKYSARALVLRNKAIYIRKTLTGYTITTAVRIIVLHPVPTRDRGPSSIISEDLSS